MDCRITDIIIVNITPMVRMQDISVSSQKVKTYFSRENFFETQEFFLSAF